MDAKTKIKEFILTEIMADAGIEPTDFDDEESLIDAGILDSLGILKLIAFLDEEMDTNIMAEEFTLDDFATLNLIHAWVERHTEPSENSGATPESPAKKAESLRPTTPMPTIADLKSAAVDHGLTDRVVLVTGASRGIGETIAKLFSIYGSRVVINFANNEDHAKRVAAEIIDSGGRALVAGANVTDRSQVDSMIRRITEHWGPVDILVNNAAGDAEPIAFEKLDWSDVARAMDVTAKGAFNCCQSVIPEMIRRGGGKIINIGTLATENPAPNQLKYVMAKSALVGLTRSLAVDYAADNIQINLVSPSVVETDLIAHIPEGYRARIARETPMRRNATSTDVAQAVVFLASAFCRFTTGQNLLVTGGAAPFL